MSALTLKFKIPNLCSFSHRPRSFSHRPRSIPLPRPRPRPRPTSPTPSTQAVVIPFGAHDRAAPLSTADRPFIITVDDSSPLTVDDSSSPLSAATHLPPPTPPTLQISSPDLIFPSPTLTQRRPRHHSPTVAPSTAALPSSSTATPLTVDSRSRAASPPQIRPPTIAMSSPPTTATQN